uniref:Uncharacterized protein n=1 Tax=Timema cristinae TaxID=61476 RepID=A0A7R9CRF2_TIMCR|nr:unnamed protein product [Timema cristinae]
MLFPLEMTTTWINATNSRDDPAAKPRSSTVSPNMAPLPRYHTQSRSFLRSTNMEAPCTNLIGEPREIRYRRHWLGYIQLQRAIQDKGSQHDVID